MKKSILEDFCPSCIHELVHGVACDWQPGECPYTQLARKQAYQHTSEHAFQGEWLAVRGEYDAVRSEN